MTRTEAKDFIDKKVLDWMNANQPHPNNHFSANLIDKEKWSKKECEQIAEDCIGYVKFRAKRAKRGAGRK